MRHFKGIKIQLTPFLKNEFWSNKRMSGEGKKTQKDMGQKEYFWSFFTLKSLSEMEEIKMIMDSGILCLQLWSANSPHAFKMLVPNDMIMQMGFRECRLFSCLSLYDCPYNVLFFLLIHCKLRQLSFYEMSMENISDFLEMEMK